MSEDSISVPKEKFFVAGIITCQEFQKSRYIVTKLHKCFPKQYELPQIRPMLNVEWEEFLTNKRRKYGNGLWAVSKPMTIFLNGEYFGDDVDLVKHVSRKFRFAFSMDWYEMGNCHLAEFLKNIMRKFVRQTKRQLAYITVSVNHRIVGTMLFELYNDLVPLASEIFLTKCKLETGGYSGTPIQRIMKDSWIQCGGFSLPEKRTPCENYVVPHDRRGVLCMCNTGRHRGNSTQFFVTLAPAPWMDYKYVAFGQLLQGAEVLRRIEAVPTLYERPQMPIDIAMSGELTFDDTPNFTSSDELRELRHMEPAALLHHIIGPTSERNVDWKRGICSMESYLRGCTPFPETDEYLSDNGKVEEADDDEMIMSTSSDQLSLNDNEAYCISPNFSDTTL